MESNHRYTVLQTAALTTWLPWDVRGLALSPASLTSRVIPQRRRAACGRGVCQPSLPIVARTTTSTGHEGACEWIAENLVIDGTRALDFGCGTGYGAALLAQAGATDDSVDSVDSVWALADDPSVDMDRAVGLAAICHQPRQESSPRRSRTRARRPVSGA